MSIVEYRVISKKYPKNITVKRDVHKELYPNKTPRDIVLSFKRNSPNLDVERSLALYLVKTYPFISLYSKKQEEYNIGDEVDQICAECERLGKRIYGKLRQVASELDIDGRCSTEEELKKLIRSKLNGEKIPENLVIDREVTDNRKKKFFEESDAFEKRTEERAKNIEGWDLEKVLAMESKKVQWNRLTQLASKYGIKPIKYKDTAPLNVLSVIIRILLPILFQANSFPEGRSHSLPIILSYSTLSTSKSVYISTVAASLIVYNDRTLSVNILLRISVIIPEAKVTDVVASSTRSGISSRV